MPQKPETTSERPHLPLQYKKATVVEEVAPVNTAMVLPDVRTVVTTVTEGTVLLRYTPREQFRLTGKTSR